MKIDLAENIRDRADLAFARGQLGASTLLEMLADEAHSIVVIE